MPTVIRFECFIDEEGQIKTNVLEGGTHCGQVKQFTGALGTELSDEKTGPDCDDVHEIQY